MKNVKLSKTGGRLAHSVLHNLFFFHLALELVIYKRPLFGIKYKGVIIVVLQQLQIFVR